MKEDNGIIDKEEWCKKLEEEDGGIATVLGLYRNRKEADQILKYIKWVFPEQLGKKERLSEIN